MENAITEAYRDMKLLHSEDTRMMRELWDIQQKISLHQPLDEVLSAFASKSGVEDIITFAQIYATARKSGGNLVKVMKRTAQNISEKMEIQREIQTMIAGKKMEANCMTAIPLFIILYLQICSPGFLDPLYEGFFGRIFMTGAFFVFILIQFVRQNLKDMLIYFVDGTIRLFRWFFFCVFIDKRRICDMMREE